MSKADILAELPKLTPAERQEVRLELARLDGEECLDADDPLTDAEKALLDAREPGLGWELTLEVRAAIRRAVENPLSCLRIRRRPEVRRILSRRFPYRIFFIVRDDAIVFALIHAARHDRRWQRRI